MNKSLPPHFRYSLLLREIDGLITATDVHAVALVLIRIDGFGAVNQCFGYLGGDHVLEEVQGRLNGIARTQDCCFQINGTTFALLIRNPLHEGHAVLAAERVVREVRQPVRIGNAQTGIKVHMGIALLPEPATCAEELLRQAELSLIMARQRDERYQVFTPELAGNGDGRLRQVWFDVEEAIKQGEFELHFQPKLCLRTGRLHGAEALLRWWRPGEGLLSPAYFLPALEATHGIRTILRFALNSALRQAADWIATAPDFSIAVNVAAANLDDPDLVDVVADCLGVWGFPPAQLVLEITESALMRDTAASAVVLERLRGLGVRLAIDDFGTGYSSLAYLRDIPASELKIDRSFVIAMANSERDRRIVGSVIELGHAVGMEVVAEGIEDANSMQALKAMGCDIGQGYYFSRPCSAEVFACEWVAAQARQSSA